MNATGSSEYGLNLRRLLLFRTVTATALLFAVLSFQLLVGTDSSLAPAYAMIGTVYALNMLWTLIERRGWLRDSLVSLQLTVDVLATSLLLVAFGGIRSPLVLLYLMIAFGGGVMTSRPTALALACLTGVAYGLMSHLLMGGMLADWQIRLGATVVDSISPAEVYLRILLLLMSSTVLASTTHHFARRLARARMALEHERSAHASLQKLNQQMLAGMSSGLIAADAHGLVIACNRAARRILEREEHELVGADVRPILGLEPGGLSELHVRLEDRQIYRGEQTVPLGEGRYRAIGMSVTRVLAGPAATRRSSDSIWSNEPAQAGPWAVTGEGPIAGGYIFMFQDLTDIKRMERMFWMRERMAVLGEMAGSLAHEIRNPLASISGSLQMLKRGDVGFSSDRGARLMEIVTRESERLSRIIEGFLDYARPEKLDATDTDLVELATETLELLRNSPEVSDAHVLHVEAVQPRVFVLADAARIRQVFWNLARNAVQAMPDGGELRIRLEPTASGAEVVFADQGAGLEPEQIDDIFRPFVSEGGTGLGLAVVYRILQLHGARVEVESQRGAGSRFVLHFENSSVAAAGAEDVVVEPSAERQTRLFDELSRSVRSE